MKVLVLAATGGTGRLIVRFRPGERPFRRGPGLLGGERRCTSLQFRCSPDLAKNRISKLAPISVSMTR